MCGELLLGLLTTSNPMTLSEDEVRLAIDLLSLDLKPAQEWAMPLSHQPSQAALLKLLNEHPELRAFLVDNEIYIRKVK